MDDRVDSRIPAKLERVSSKRIDGGAFRRFPILPVVAVVTFFLGLSLGLELAPKGATERVPTSAPSAVPASPSATVTLSPTPLASPPAGGVTMGQAIAAVKAAFPIEDSDTFR